MKTEHMINWAKTAAEIQEDYAALAEENDRLRLEVALHRGEIADHSVISWEAAEKCLKPYALEALRAIVGMLDNYKKTQTSPPMPPTFIGVDPAIEGADRTAVVEMHLSAADPLVTYVLCPGHVRSRYDDDVRYISAERLAKLYGVREASCVLFPRTDGCAGMPTWWPAPPTPCSFSRIAVARINYPNEIPQVKENPWKSTTVSSNSLTTC